MSARPALETRLRIVRDPETPDAALRDYYERRRIERARQDEAREWLLVRAIGALLGLAFLASCWIGWGDILGWLFHSLKGR